MNAKELVDVCQSLCEDVDGKVAHFEDATERRVILAFLVGWLTGALKAGG